MADVQGQETLGQGQNRGPTVQGSEVSSTRTPPGTCGLGPARAPRPWGGDLEQRGKPSPSRGSMPPGPRDPDAGWSCVNWPARTPHTSKSEPGARSPAVSPPRGPTRPPATASAQVRRARPGTHPSPIRSRRPPEYDFLMVPLWLPLPGK